MKCSTPPTTEIWKAIVGTAGRYEASNLGRVRAKFSSAGRPRTNANIFDGELVSAYIGDRDFQNVMIDQKVWSVAACVLSAFVGPRPSNDHKACYLDGDRLNVKLSNLAWLTTAENKKLTRDLGRSALRPSKLVGKVRQYQCRKCLEWFPARGFYKLASGTYRTGNRLSQCGLASECRGCNTLRRREYRQKYGDGGAPTLIQKILPVMEELDGIVVSSDEPDRGGIAARLAAARVRRGLNRSELARRADVESGTIDRLENGISIPRESTLRKIIAVLKPPTVISVSVEATRPSKPMVQL